MQFVLRSITLETMDISGPLQLCPDAFGARAHGCDLMMMSFVQLGNCLKEPLWDCSRLPLLA